MKKEGPAKEIIINATGLYDGRGYQPNRTVVIRNGKIADVSKKSAARAHYSGIVTPAFIDPHSHIGMFREGEPGAEQEGNETLNQILPLSDPLNGIYFDDRAFQDAIDFGVLYSAVMPGSGNLFGGKVQVIKNWAKHRAEAQVLDFGYKMALGYNPRSTQGWKGDRPNTRMGLYGMLEKRFDEVLARAARAELAREKKESEVERKLKKKEIDKKQAAAERDFIAREYDLEFSREDQAFLDVLKRKKTVKIHVHKEDDVIYLLELRRRYNMRVTAEHTGDVFHTEIFRMLADEGVPITYGPLGGLGYKVELMHAYYQNAKLLMDSGAFFGLMSDHPVIHVSGLRESLKFFLIHGMPAAEAISLLTYRNAKMLGLEKELGSIAPGMRASVLVWDGDPLHLASFPRTVIGEGSVLRG